MFAQDCGHYEPCLVDTLLCPLLVVVDQLWMAECVDVCVKVDQLSNHVRCSCSYPTIFLHATSTPLDHHTLSRQKGLTNMSDSPDV